MQTDFMRFLAEESPAINEYIQTYFKPGIHPDMDRYLYHPLAHYSANAGKRHRPLLCLIGCKAVGGSFEAALSAAAAVEHFHTAALIHDDIADGSELRRSQPCMHLVEGDGIAINAADLALSLVTGSILNDKSLDDATKITVLNLLIEMTTRTIEGQALDVGWARDGRFDLTVDDYLLMADHKTAFYSGAVPLACGAVIGKGSPEQIAALREFGMLTGLAFQIQDDYLNLVGEKDHANKDFRSDITEGKRTLIAVHALDHSVKKARLAEILSMHTTDEALLDEAVVLMQAAGSITYAKEYSIMITNKAKEILDATEFDPECVALLHSMADFFIDRYV